MKKALVILLIAVLAVSVLLSIAVLKFDFYDSEPGREYSVTDGLSNKEIAKDVMGQYFDYYKSHGVKTRLLDFRINDIVMCDEEITKSYTGDKEGFVFYISFDVKPFFGGLFDEWYAGNGDDKPDGWCVDKTGYYMITVENDVYCLEYIGTMC